MSDFSFLKSAYEFAAKESTDPSTQNGVILVGLPTLDAEGNFYRPFVQAANHFPSGVKEEESRWQRPLKYCYVEHSERNAIYFAAKKGIKTEGATMYAAWASCSDCARAIIQAGVSELVTHHDPYAKVRFGQPVSDVWLDSVMVGLSMLNEAGVKIRWINDKIFLNDEVKIRFNGVLVSP